MKLLAIDPGATHVGLALFSDHPVVRTLDGQESQGELWVVERVWESNPRAFEPWLWEQLEEHVLDRIVIEDFLIARIADPEDRYRGAYSNAANGTIECIGAVKCLCRLFGTPFDTQFPRKRLAAEEWLAEQNRKPEAVKRRAGGHAKSAELHGWRWIKDRGGIPV